MQFPHPHFDIPELRVLSYRDRYLVWRECVHPQTIKIQNLAVTVLVVMSGAALGGLIGTWFLPFSWGSTILCGLFAGGSSYLTSWASAWRYRERIQKFGHIHLTNRRNQEAEQVGAGDAEEIV